MKKQVMAKGAKGFFYSLKEMAGIFYSAGVFFIFVFVVFLPGPLFAERNCSYTTFTSPELGFSLEYPENWKVSLEHGGAATFLANPDSDGCVPNIFVNAFFVGSACALEDALGVIEKSYEGVDSIKVVSKVYTTTKNGLPVARVTRTYRVGPKNRLIYEKSGYIQSGDTIWHVMGTASLVRFRDYEACFDRAIDSFRVDDRRSVMAASAGREPEISGLDKPVLKDNSTVRENSISGGDDSIADALQVSQNETPKLIKTRSKIRGQKNETLAEELGGSSRSQEVAGSMNTVMAGSTMTNGAGSEIIFRQTTEREVELLANASREYEKKNLEKAQEFIQQFLSFAPASLEGNFLLGKILLEKGDFKTARKIFEKLVSLAPNSLSYRNYFVDILLRCGELKKALVEARVAFDLKGSTQDMVMAYINMGNIFLAERKFDKAIEMYRMGIEKYPNDERLWNNLASAERKMGRLDSAEASYAQALKLNPRYILALLGMASLMEEKGLSEEALKYYSVAKKVEPANGLVFLQMALLYEKKGEQEQARTHFEEVRKLDPALYERYIQSRH